MKLFLKVLLVLLIVVLGLGIIYYPKLKRVYHAMNLFEESKIVDNMRTVNDWWDSRPIDAPKTIHQFPKKNGFSLPESFNVGNSTINATEFIEKTYTTGLLVLQSDSIIYEEYFRDHKPETEQIVWSVSKSFLSALFGIAIDEGHIKSIEQSVDEYCPSLIGSGYEGVRIKDVLQMSTGIAFNEDYADFNSDINRWGRDFSWGNSQDAFAASLQRDREPGTYNHYVSLDTHVLGMILVQATGKDITEYAQEKLWNPLGMEHDSHWLIDDYGMEAALGGLTTTVRNCAKLGYLFLNEGNWFGKQIVSASWVKSSTTPDAPHLIPGNRTTSAHDLGYGFQWWIPEGNEGEFLAVGVYNQFIYINPATKTIVVKHSANPGFGKGDFLSSSSVFVELCRKIAKENQKLDDSMEIDEVALKN